MSHVTGRPWELLFPPASHNSETTPLRFRLLRKQGRPLLLVPSGVDLAASMALYPAQSLKAKLARSLARLALQTRLPVAGESVAISIESSRPFESFLKAAAGGSEIPRCAVFFCNPRPGGQRFVLLVFDRNGTPVRVIKAGAGSGASELIQREAAFLSQLNQKRLPEIPKVTASFDSPALKALALDYVRGETAKGTDLRAAGTVLARWLDPCSVKLHDLPAWQQVRAMSSDALLGRLEQLLESAPMRAAIHHGDFAPWNIRINRTSNSWYVLDWERGEMKGPPGWDWFHLLVQPAILVRRAQASAIASELEQFLESAEFRQYAQLAGIESSSRLLAIAYLLHAHEVIRPTEGGSATAELLALLCERWLG